MNTLFEQYETSIFYAQNVKNIQSDKHTVKFGSLIGLIPEDSAENIAAHEYAEKVSRQIVDSMAASASGVFSAWLDEKRDVIALTIEDFLARHILILESFAAAANNNGNGDVLLVGAGLGYFDTSLRVLLSRLKSDKIWLCVDQPSSDLENYRAIFEPSSEGAEAEGADIAPSDAAAANWYEKNTNDHAELLNAHFAEISVNTQNSYLILANLSHRYFGESAVSLAGALKRQGDRPIIINSSTIKTTAPNLEGLWSSCHQPEDTANKVPILSMHRQKTSDAEILSDIEGLKTWIYGCVKKLKIDYHGTDATDAFAHFIARTLGRDLPFLLFNDMYAKKLLGSGRPRSVIALSSRESHDRIIAENARLLKIPITEVQSVDILRHPRYKKPIADHFTVIDGAAASTFEEYFKIPANTITVTGSPRTDIMAHPDRVSICRDLLDARGLAPQPAVRVLFTTRTGEFELNLETLRIVARICAGSPGAQLIVKTHPREEPIRLAAYAEVLNTAGVGGTHNVLSEGSAETLVQLSDCVVSFPSNVVRDALAARKKTLLYAPDGVIDNEALEQNSSYLFRAATPAELEKQIRKLVKPARPVGRKGMEAKDDSVIANIIRVVEKNARQCTEETTDTARAISINPKYSRLSLQETLDEISRRGDAGNDRKGVLTLLERAITLGRASDELQRILVCLDNYAPHSLAAAMLFSTLAKKARGDDAFHQAIAELASEKLSGFARQLVFSHTLHGPFAALALAHASLAVGKLEQGRKWLEMADVKGYAPALAARAGSELSSLTLRQWRGSGEIDDVKPIEKLKRIIIIAERGSDPHLVRQMLPTNMHVDIYCESPAGEIKPADDGAKIMTSQDFLGDFAPEIQDIVTTANEFARRATSKVLTGLKSSEHIAWMKQIEDALQMELRGSTITQLRRRSALKNAVNGDYDAVVFCCASPAFFALFSDIADTAAKPVFVAGAAIMPKRRAAFGKVRTLGLSTVIDRQLKQLEIPNKPDHAAASKEFDQRLSKIISRIPARVDKQAIIAVTRWRIATIKDGLLSLLENLPSGIALEVFDTSRDAGSAKGFLADVREFEAQSGISIRPYSGQKFNAVNAKLQELRNNELTQAIIAGVSGTQAWRTLSHSVQLSTRNQIGVLLHKIIPLLFNLHTQISAVCDNSGAAALVLMPGRDAESITAQNAVHQFGLKTIDVQTAYFGKGHTYTGPRGDIVTAFDEWSRDIFVDWLGVQKERIRIVGTSRFDRFAKLRKANEKANEKTKTTSPKRPQICFAIQPIQFEVTEKILGCLDSVLENGMDIDCTVKLHPRQPESIIPNIKRAAKLLDKKSRLFITKDSDLAEILLASDVVITIFSNVALEAALLGRPVLLANFMNEALPIPFDEFGIARVVHTETEFADCLKKMLFDGDYQNELTASRKRYFDKHPAQWAGDSGIAITDLIMDNMRKPKPLG